MSKAVVKAIAIVVVSWAVAMAGDEGPTEGLVAWWPFDEGKGSVATDRSKSANDIRFRGPKWVEGKFGYALEFDGKTDMIYIHTGTMRTPLTPTKWKGITISLWVKPSGPRSSKGPWLMGFKYYGPALGLTSDNKPYGRFGGRLGKGWCHFVVIVNTSLSPGKWYHLTFVAKQGSEGYGKIYINGELDGVRSTRARFTSDAQLFFGMGALTGEAARFAGALDDIRIYNRALSPEEVESLFLLGAPAEVRAERKKRGEARLARKLAVRGEQGLVAYWPLDEGRGGIAYDLSENENDGLIQNGVWSISREGSALEFLGPTHVDVGRHACFEIQDELTVLAWVYPVFDEASAKSGGTIISTGNASNCHDYDCGYTFRCDSGVLLFSIRPEDAPEQNGYYRVHSKKGIPEHAWSHVAVIYSVKSNAVPFFINGEQAGQAPAKGRIVFRGCPLWIGAEPKFGGARPFHGFIREVKLYNRALSQDEIKKHFEATKGIASLKLETVEEKRLKALEERCTSTLRVRIIDAGTGEALCARVWVFGPDGKNYFPQKCLFARYRSRNKDKGYFYAFGGFEVKVPPGRIEVVAIRGFEFLPGRERFDLKHGEKKEAVIHMRRLVNMPEKGWWCGDYDIDAYKGSRIKDFRTACAICKAEGLNFVSLCSVPWWRKERCVAKSAHFIAGAGYEPGFAPAGHMDVVWSSPDVPGVEKRPEGWKPKYPDNTPLDTVGFAERVYHGQGKLATFCHPYSGYPNIAGRADCLARGIPLLVAFDLQPIYHVLRGTQGMKDWYRLLNLGFKVGAGEGGDVNLQALDIPGRVRVYVRAEKLDFPDILRGLRQRRTFATYGPLLIFEVNGKGVGEILCLDGRKPERLRLHVEAYSIAGMEKAEVIKNGEVVKTLMPKESGQIVEDFELLIGETCWFALRGYGKKSNFVGTFAHTSPVFVQFGDEPMKPDRKDIDYFIWWLDEYSKAIPLFCKLFGKEREWAQKAKSSLRLIEKAKEKYRSLIAKPRKWVNTK